MVERESPVFLLINSWINLRAIPIWFFTVFIEMFSFSAICWWVSPWSLLRRYISCLRSGSKSTAVLIMSPNSLESIISAVESAVSTVSSFCNSFLRLTCFLNHEMEILEAMRYTQAAGLSTFVNSALFIQSRRKVSWIISSATCSFRVSFMMKGRSLGVQI